MKSQPNATYENSLPPILIDQQNDILISQQLIKWWQLHIHCINLQLPPNNCVEISIKDHIARYTDRYINYWYTTPYKNALRDQPWHLINDRGGYKSIVGAYHEHLIMITLLVQGYDVKPAVTKQEQVVNQWDFVISLSEWKRPISCQSKSVLGCMEDGSFTRPLDIFDKWSKTKADRIYISDDNTVLWCDSILFKGLLSDIGALSRAYTSTSLKKLYNQLKRKNPSFDGNRYGTFDKLQW